MIGLFLANSDLNSLIALPRDQLQEVSQPGVALSSFRSAGCKDFACGFLALEFPDSHSLPISFRYCTNLSWFDLTWRGRDLRSIVGGWGEFIRFNPLADYL